jgi:large subunit ribosomal protein L24
MPTKAQHQPVKLNIRKGDQVVVLTGKNRDRKTPREVLSVSTKTGKIVVDGVNLHKDTPNKRNRAAGQSDEGITEKAMPIDASNVMLVDPKTGVPTRVKRVKGEDGKITRISVKSGEAI